MEGLRQRHCVASYHDRIYGQELAICVVFIDSVRWTVELRLNESEEYPLTIQSIRSKLNQMPSMAVKNRIHDVLGIKRHVDTKRLTTQGPDKSALWRDNLAIVIDVMRATDISSVIVNFDGSGDSGTIDSVTFFNRILTEGGERKVVADITHIDPIQIHTLVSSFEQGQWVRQSSWKDVSLVEACEQICDDYLETTDVDWYNDDGGFGEMTIDFIEEEISMEVYVRYTDSTNAFDETTSFEELLDMDADKAA